MTILSELRIGRLLILGVAILNNSMPVQDIDVLHMQIYRDWICVYMTLLCTLQVPHHTTKVSIRFIMEEHAYVFKFVLTEFGIVPNFDKKYNNSYMHSLIRLIHMSNNHHVAFFGNMPRCK